jgi:hypothetical protein
VLPVRVPWGTVWHHGPGPLQHRQLPPESPCPWRDDIERPPGHHQAIAGNRRPAVHPNLHHARRLSSSEQFIRVMNPINNRSTTSPVSRISLGGRDPSPGKTHQHSFCFPFALVAFHFL